jgi:enoyl-CoA hydratase
MEGQYVRVERDGPVAIVRLDRPPVNALELNLVTQAFGALDEVIAGDARAIVLAGTGNSFSAGLDLKLVPGYSKDEQYAMIAAANRFLTRIYSLPRPVVAAVNGHAIAGGFVVMLACDYRVGSQAPCKLGLTEARAGIPFPAAAMMILRAELAPAVARVLTLVARNVGPEAALEKGVLDELQPADRVLPRAIEVARDMAGIPGDTYARIKHQLRAEVSARLEEIVASGVDPMFTNWIGSETASAAAALLRGEGGT